MTRTRLISNVTKHITFPWADKVLKKCSKVKELISVETFKVVTLLLADRIHYACIAARPSVPRWLLTGKKF